MELKNKRILVTGGAGFIGSHIVEAILAKGAKCRVLDDLSTGSAANFSTYSSNNGFEFVQGSITSYDICKNAMEGIDMVLHLAALGSVPRSINNPLATNEVNVTGFLNVLYAAENSGIKRFVFSSSSSVYGDDEHLPKREEVIGTPLSPYAISKMTNELYALNFSRLYDMEVIGLRYFNVFGPRQNPKGPYAAVIPIFVQNMIQRNPCYINGDGTITRDFTYVSNVVNANLLAATTDNKIALNKVYNIAFGETISLLDLHQGIANILGLNDKPKFRDERPGDIKNSLADITQARTYLGYKPVIGFFEGLKSTVQWYQNHLNEE